MNNIIFDIGMFKTSNHAYNTNKFLQVSLNYIKQFFLALSIILLPFNDLSFFKSILREMSKEGAFYPLAVVVLIFCCLFLRGKAIKLPKHISFQFLMSFLFWILVSGMINLFDIATLQTKGRTGLEKFLFQLILNAFVVCATCAIYNVLIAIQNPMRVIRRYIMISFIIVSLYSVVEIFFLAGFGWASNTLELINQFVHDGGDLYYGRLRSVSGEASWFAMYCSFALPWLLSYVFTETKLFFGYLLMFCYALFLITLSWSRTAYVITTVQVVLFILGLVYAGKIKFKMRHIAFLLVLLLIPGLAAYLFQETIFSRINILDIFTSLLNSQNLSNIARNGSSLAAFKMALYNPVFGVGLGQYGFYMPMYIPGWAQVSPEVQSWMSSSVDTAWPPVHNIYCRIAGELGFVGCAIWLAIWCSVLITCYKHYKLAYGYEKIFSLSLLVSLIGVLLSGFNLDSMRFFGYWFILSITWAYTSRDSLRKPAA